MTNLTTLAPHTASLDEDTPTVVAISLRQYGERTAPLIANARRGHTKLSASTDEFAQSTRSLTTILSQFRLP